MTYLQLVNSVLRRLREREAANVNDNALIRLIGDFVNDAKREVEDAFDWNVLRRTSQLVTTGGTFRYKLTDLGLRYRLMKDNFGRFQVFNNSEDIFLRRAPSTRWMSYQLNSQNTPDIPMWFDINGVLEGDPRVDLFPVPDKAYTLFFEVVVPQEDLSLDSDELLVTHHPVIFGAWARAIAERGEDAGITASDAYRQYQSALSDAIAYEAENLSDRMVAHVV